MENNNHEDFRKFLKETSEEVKKWPEWKKNCLGRIKVIKLGTPEQVDMVSKCLIENDR